MSTYEYIDLCEKAQNEESKYHVFTFDIVNSKKMNKELRNIAAKKVEQLMHQMYIEIKLKEKKENKKILLTEDIVPYDKRNNVDKKFGMLFEPFLFADTFGFTVYNNSITIDEIYQIYENCKYELEIDFDFHINNLYYETNDYGEGGNLFFRGYAIDICSSLNKPKYNKIKKKLYK